MSGSNRLVVRDMQGGQTHVIVERSPDVQWIMPRFSPDGGRIAVQRWKRGGGHDVVVLENDRITRVIDSGSVDGAPAWSADGKYVLFSSDISGISNLYASDGQSIRQVTNVLAARSIPMSVRMASGSTSRTIMRMAFTSSACRTIRRAGS